MCFDIALIMAADTVAGYIDALLDGVQFRRSSYSHDRASRKAALDAFIRRAKGDEEIKSDRVIRAAA